MKLLGYTSDGNAWVGVGLTLRHQFIESHHEVFDFILGDNCSWTLFGAGLFESLAQKPLSHHSLLFARHNLAYKALLATIEMPQQTYDSKHDHTYGHEYDDIFLTHIEFYFLTLKSGGVEQWLVFETITVKLHHLLAQPQTVNAALIVLQKFQCFMIITKPLITEWRTRISLETISIIARSSYYPQCFTIGSYGFWMIV